MAIEYSTIVCCTALAVFLRWSVATFPYSGEGKPPQYGDFEAHRHWMEITVNIPMSKWYFNSTNNDLDYWGIDYPPLSAFHSYAIGRIFKKIYPEAVKLKISRGYESSLLKFLMRFSVSSSDLLIPALIMFCTLFSNTEKRFAPWACLLLSLAAPPFIMVDYGHFQYNCVSLGLTVFAVITLLLGQFSISAILFTLAVHHKQMSLYHSLSFFAYMFGTLVFKRVDVLTTFRVGTVILSTMGLMWLPFGDYWIFVFRRIFPLKRGVFEDKVGTFWYMLDRFVPIKGVYPDELVAQVCGIATILLLLPATWNLFIKASTLKGQTASLRKTFLLHMFNSSLVCFLFSYHVHEKTIMLPSLAAVLLIPSYPFPSVWFISVASLSMYPLFLEEGSHVALILTTAIFILIAQQGKVFSSETSTILKLAFVGSIGGYVLLILGLNFLTPPKNLPHLFQAVIAILSFLHFAFFCLWFHFLQIRKVKTTEVKSKPKSSLSGSAKKKKH